MPAPVATGLIGMWGSAPGDGVAVGQADAMLHCGGSRVVTSGGETVSCATMTKKPSPSPSAPAVSRRRMLKAGLVAAGSTSMVAMAAHGASKKVIRPLDVPPWTKSEGRNTGAAYGLPSRYEKHVGRMLTKNSPTKTASWSFTPIGDLHGMVTPNGLIFERHHAGIPDIDPAKHRLVVHGDVDQSLMFTMNDLKRFPAVSRFYFLECSGNTYMEWRQPTGGTVQWTHGLISCCQWTGVPLASILREAGMKPSARWLLAEGADGAAMTRSIPVSKAMDDVLVVYAQNGEMLRPEHGYPLRLIVPGWEGNVNVKWLRRIKLADKPFHTRQETSKYTDLQADGRARQFSFLMEAKSVITTPSVGQRLDSRGFYEIRGLAWSGLGRIARVDVSLDGGRNWQPAQLDEPVLPKCLTVFRMPWRWNGDRTAIMSRAIDETGYVQPTRKQIVAARGNNFWNHYNGIQAWQVETDGTVTNVPA